ncbi:aspartyl-phosphate phosphatase Spo0E family protein [Paenibacillus sp. GD4]|jgi:hypothetical protein|uniref:aspartyl-phosphate phosphatase Spo0E family protein n=1 Tax=Paenibacillus TaxID=44249 RepID=UPI0025426B5E|nr:MULTISPECIES: aspartyl-phosphate phosphatase Spo0E family protein [Paenibacillus]MDQ1912116.1 aspartyl-phosphate phosphatase Spo0E family protein [Paenibacillus sp. GD4]
MLPVVNWMDEDAELSCEIETLRAHMVELGSVLGLMHPDVQRCSKQLDELLLRYYEIHRIRKLRGEAVQRPLRSMPRRSILKE